MRSFFFSSRRRHTRYWRDWSSDVCSSDLGNYYGISKFYAGEQTHPMIMRDNGLSRQSGFNVNGSIYANFMPFKGFTFTSRFGYRLGGARQSSVSLPFYGNAVQGNDYEIGRASCRERV